MKRIYDLNLTIIHILWFSLPYYFIEFLFFRELDLSYTQIGFLGIITETVSLVMDIPLSSLVYKTGYKKMLLGAHVLMMGALACLFYAQFYLFCLLSALLFGLAQALSSGTLSAYSYEYFDKEDDYEAFLKQTNMLKYGLTAIVTLITPYLMSQMLYAPIVLSLIFCGLSFLMLWSLKAVPVQDNREEQSHLSSILAHLKSFSKSTLLYGILFSTLVMMANSYASIFLTEQGFPLKYIGGVLFAFNLMMALGSHIQLPRFLLIFLPLSLVLLSFSGYWAISILLFLILRFLNANFINDFSLRFNESIQGDRALIWSLYSFGMSLAFILSDFLSGVMSDAFGLPLVYLIYGVIGAFIALLFGAYAFWTDRRKT